MYNSANTSHISLAGETDQQVWLQLREGDKKAFTELFNRYHGILYNYGKKLSSDSSIVEDAVQDVFVDIWRLKCSLAENITSVKFYLYRALRRRIHQGSEKFPVTDEISLLPDYLIPHNNSDSERILIESESAFLMKQRINELLSTLPERQIEALTLRYFDNFSTAEIAHIMNVTEKSVRNFIYRALTSLRQNQQISASALITCLLTLVNNLF